MNIDKTRLWKLIEDICQRRARQSADLLYDPATATATWSADQSFVDLLTARLQILVHRWADLAHAAATIRMRPDERNKTQRKRLRICWEPADFDRAWMFLLAQAQQE